VIELLRRSCGRWRWSDEVWKFKTIK